MRLLLTGAAGFLGAEVLRNVPPGCSVTTLDRVHMPGEHIMCNLDDRESLEASLCGLHFDAVIHLAGATRGSLPELDRDNVRATGNLIGTVDATRFAAASSCAVYGRPLSSDGTVTEDHPLDPVSDYGRSMVERERECSGSLVIRFFNVTGPGQEPGMLVPDLAKKLAEIARGRERPPLRTGPLDTRRDYLDVRDAAAVLLAAVEGPVAEGIFNAGSGVCRSGREVLRALSRAMGVHPELSKTELPPGIPAIRADISRASRVLGWAPRISFEESMRSVADRWLREEDWQGPG